MDALASLPQLASTRFGIYSNREVPQDHDKRAKLLILCGYETRLTGDTVEVRASGWIPALLPGMETTASYLRKQCALMQPSRAMDVDDPAFDAVFADR